MTSYDTQQEFIAKKAQEKGIASSVILDYFHEKLSQVYAANPHSAESWALGRSEYLVWEHFCKCGNTMTNDLVNCSAELGGSSWRSVPRQDYEHGRGRPT